MKRLLCRLFGHRFMWAGYDQTGTHGYCTRCRVSTFIPYTAQNGAMNQRRLKYVVSAGILLAAIVYFWNVAPALMIYSIFGFVPLLVKFAETYPCYQAWMEKRLNR